MSYLRASPPGTLTERDRARPGQVRRIVRAQLRHWGLEDLVEPAQLVVSELVTNAFQHARGDEVGIRLGRSGRTVRIEVRTGPVHEVAPYARPGARSGPEARGVPSGTAVHAPRAGARPGPHPGPRAPYAPREGFDRSAPGPRSSVPPEPIPQDPLSERGRGLDLVEALVDDWGVQAGGAVVWCTLSSPSPSPS
ncbi:ATP-binding protein [Streptomyces sp. NPDC049906]|uniref:ATP-binding protein n=1 Tax=Streptomyces sp. NPDC049906 TaxID=3155656 RepID=UPI00343405EE